VFLLSDLDPREFVFIKLGFRTHIEIE